MVATAKQYAVIEARWTEHPSERFVISYSDEESLRDLIAGPNILACGFASLRDAEAHVDASLISAAPRTQPGSRACRNSKGSKTHSFPGREFGNWLLSNSDLENSSRILRCSGRHNRSRLLFQECSFHSNRIRCWAPHVKGH